MIASMLPRFSRTALVFSLAGFGLLAAATARAAMFVTLTNGASTVTVFDNLAGDSNPTPGQIAYFGPVGNFSTTITIATSNSPGSPADSILQISSIDVRNVSAGPQTLQVIVGDTGFLLPSGPGLTLKSSYAGTLTNPQPGDFTTFQSFADTSNTQGGTVGGSVTSTPLQAFTVVTPASPQSFSTPDLLAPFAASAPYSITNITNVTLSPNGQSNVSGTTEITPASGNGTPEPATLMLLAPAALALLARRRRA